jgi:hypothetical protein
MKTSKLLPHPVKILALLLGSCLSILAAGRAHAQTADLFASVNHPNPTGPGAINQYTPAGVQGTFVASVVQPRGLAFDCAGNLFVASTGFDNNGNSVGSILEVTPGGAVSTFTTGFPNNYFLEDIKFDSMGNLFVMANNDSDPLVASTIFKVSPGGGVSIFGTLPGQGFGLAFDSMGNLFAADASDATIFKFTPAGTRSVFAAPSAFLPNQGPIGLAFNSAGNLFVSTSDNSNGQILEFAPNGAETIFAMGLTNNPRGLAFDSAGNLFVAEPGSFRSGDILKFTPGGVETFFATPVGRPQGDGGPEFLAFPTPSSTYSAQIRPPINSDGSSVFSDKRGVVPVKFTLTQCGTPTCALPPATIALTRTAGATTGAINESVYIGSADTGSNFRIAGCQYIYNLSSSALGPGTYRVDIKINGNVVGSAVFQLK